MSSTDKILPRLAAWCSRAERCKADVRRKLDLCELSEKEKREILDRLLEEHFIDETRYCRAFVNDKSKYSRWGTAKIRYELMKKQIPETIINEALETIDPKTNIERLSELLAKKIKTVKGNSAYEIRMKLFRFAAGRGFSIEETEKALKNFVI